jgi:two-component system, NarL family, invasion response regulator UvrY
VKSFLLIDDHEIIRRGLNMLIMDFYPDAHVLEAHDGDSAIELLKKNSFDLIMFDVQMPNTNSFGLFEYIMNFYPQANVLVFSMGSEMLYGRRFIIAGAKGYLSKNASIDEVRKAIDSVLSGHKYISENLIDAFIGEPKKSHRGNPFSQLSDREFEITSLILSGLSVSEIGQQLHIQPSTVGTYKTRIFEKLNVSNVIQLKELASLYNFL